MKVFVDASRNRSGGAVEYLVGVFGSQDTNEFDGTIFLYAPLSVLEKLHVDPKKIVKKTSWMIEGNLILQVLWQAFVVPYILLRQNFDILFSTDASTLSFFKNHVVMSQDMLSYEPGIMDLYKIGFRKFRIWLIYHIQNGAFRRAKGVIFLTEYARSTISEHCGELNNSTVIPHGVKKTTKVAVNRCLLKKESNIELIYVSNAAPYKNQWNVIEAVGILRREGFNVNLRLIGGGIGSAQILTEESISRNDPDGKFITQYGYLQRNEVESLVRNSDVYIFASSCENLPITLLEGMAVGLPVVSSSRGPMPEVLKNGGLYFDPAFPSEIANALKETIIDDNGRLFRRERSISISENFTWQRTAADTFHYLKTLRQPELNQDD